MARTKLYAAVYVVLFVFATLQVIVERAQEDIAELVGSVGIPFGYWEFFGVVIVLSFVKAFAVAGYFQHLKWEPRSITYLMMVGLGAALALTLAAGYSIT